MYNTTISVENDKFIHKQFLRVVEYIPHKINRTCPDVCSVYTQYLMREKNYTS